MDFELRSQIIAFTWLGSLGRDTIKYMQLLEQMFLKYENDMDDFWKLHALFTGLRPDIKHKCLLDRNDNQWCIYVDLRERLHKVGPTYDQEVRAYGSKKNKPDKSLGVNKIIRKHHAL